MQEQIGFIIGEIRSALRFRWIGFGLAALVCAGGWTYVAVMPNVYEAEARFVLTTSSMLERALEDQIIATDPEVRLAAVRESLFGREQLSAVARRAGVDVEADTPIAFEAMLNGLRRDIVFDSVTTTDARSATADRVYHLSYQHEDRTKALAVVQELLNTFIEGALGESRRDEERSIQALDRQIRAAEAAAAAAEAAEAAFKRLNADRLPGAEGDFQRRLEAADQDLSAARRSLNSLESRLEQHDQQLENLRQFLPNSTAEIDPNSLPAQIRRNQLEYDQLRGRLTPSHPDLIELQSAIDSLTRQYQQELEAAGIEGADPGLMTLEANPVYQEAQIARAETELAIAERRAEIRDLERQIADLLSRRDESLDNEAELARLERHSENAARELETLRAAKSEIARTVVVQEDGPVQYSAVNEPFASMLPAGPPRLKYLLAVFIGAIGAGAALCYGLAQLRPIFANASALGKFAELPVLGVVTNAWPAGEQSAYWRSVLSYGAAWSLLAVALAGLVSIEIFGPGIHTLVSGG